MYYTYIQETNRIEIVLQGDVDRDEFKQVIHQLESLCAMYNNVEVIIDATQIQKYNFTMAIEEFDFYTRYLSRLKKVAVVSKKEFHDFLLKMFDVFSNTEFRTFRADDIEAARKWIFPSRLPA